MQRINAHDLDKVVHENPVAYVLLHSSSDDPIVVCVLPAASRFVLLRLLRMRLLRIPNYSSAHLRYLCRPRRSFSLSMTSQRQCLGQSWRSKTITRRNLPQYFTHPPYSLLTHLTLGSLPTASQPLWSSHAMYSSR
jgi:hypothetical protein